MVENQEEAAKSRSVKKERQKSEVFVPVLGEGKSLWVQLKIPKVEKEGEIKDMDEEDEMVNIGYDRSHKNQMNNDRKRVCRVCSKVFSSGKALGGHMRIHAQESNSKNKFLRKAHHRIWFKKQNPREERENLVRTTKHDLNSDLGYGGGTTGSGNKNADRLKKQICVVCGKKFPSLKSLFGHMRCHPEREWRGVQPPQTPPKVKNSSSSSSLSDAEAQKMEVSGSGDENRAVNLTESLKQWPAAAKRRRNSGAAELSRTEDEDEDADDDQLRDAVNDLLMLARHSFDKSDDQPGNYSFSNSNIIDSKLVQRVDRSSVKIKNREEKAGSNEVEKTVVGYDERESVNKLEISNNITGKEEWIHQGDAEYFNKCIYTSDGASVQTIIKNKRKIKKKMKLCDLELQLPQNSEASSIVPTPSTDKYRCDTCDKTFSTHQAFGGHRSSHTKFKIVIKNSIDLSLDHNLSSNPSFILREPKLEEETDHRSNWADDQGLMQLHQSMTCKISKIHQAEALVSPGEGSQTCRRVLDFDLNEMPPSENGD